MRNSLVGTVVAALCISVAASAARGSWSSPTDLVNHFYSAGRQSLSSNLPSAVELQGSRHFLSDRLFDLFVAALKYQADWIARHPGEPSKSGGARVIYKPPFVDGDIFTGSPDGASVFEVSEAIASSENRWLVKVESKPEPQMSPWAIAVVVVLEGDQYVIDDVLYNFADDGSSSGSLAEHLTYRDDG